MTASPPPLVPSVVRAIVFDLDGTLVDSYAAIAASVNHAREHFGMTPLDPARVRARVGRGLEALLAELVGAHLVQPSVRLFRQRYAEVYAGQTVVLPSVADTLRQLQRSGYAMAVASNKPARFSNPILEQTGLLRFFGSVQGPDLVASHKPEPAMIRRCLEELQVAPDESVYVGDMLLDVESAARAGLPVILVSGGSSAESELRSTGQLLLTSFPGLLELLPAHPAGRT